MVRQIRMWSTLAAMAVVLVAACSGDGPTSARVEMGGISANASVAPVTTSGNPTCATTQGGQDGLGYLTGRRWDTGAASQTYTLTVADLGTITFTTNGNYNGLTSWTSTFPIDAVVMKGGNQGANVYRYPTGATADNDLTTPKNVNNNGEETGTNAGISHIDFCWYGRFTPVVSTPTPSYERDYQWALAKAVDATSPTSITTGSPVTINYTVTATRTTEGDSKFTIGGTITVRNPAGYAASGTISSVKVQVDAGTPVDATCGTLPTAIPTNGTLTCTYTLENVPNASAGSTHTVKATVSGSGTYATTTTATAGVTFGEPTSTVDASATLADNQYQFSGPNGTIAVTSADLTNGTKTFPYAVTYNGPGANTRFTQCGDDAYMVTNTAMLTTATDAALTKTVEYKFDVTGCTPVIAVTGTPTWARDYDWTIDKTVEAGSTTTMAIGSTATINYKVALTPTAKETYQLTGTVTVSNPRANGYGPYTPMGVVSVDVPGAIGTPAVTCTNQPTQVNEDGSFSCEYTATVLDKDPRDVTASITKPAGSFWAAATSSPTSVTFPGSPNDTFDEKVTVTDDRYTFTGTTGTVTAAAPGQAIPLTYSITQSPETCGSYTIENTAEFETNDNKEKARDKVSHAFDVTGCAFTVTTTAGGSAVRDYNWTIAKTASAPTSTPKGTPVTINYTVTTTRDAGSLGQFAATGSVVVTNGYGPQSIGGVTVSVGGTPATVTCPANFPILVPTEGVTCTFTASVGSLTPGQVTATVTPASLTYWTTTQATATPAAFTITERDASATITDYVGTNPADGLIALPNGGKVQGSGTLSYTWTSPAYTACVPVTVINNAILTEEDSRRQPATASVTNTINVTGCSTDGTAVGTAWAYKASVSKTFTSFDPAIKRWGWYNPWSETDNGVYRIIVGAGGNNLSNGTDIGTVTVGMVNDKMAVKEINLRDPNYRVTLALYAGSTPLPVNNRRNNTVAPGQFYVTPGVPKSFVLHLDVRYVQE